MSTNLLWDALTKQLLFGARYGSPVKPPDPTDQQKSHVLLYQQYGIGMRVSPEMLKAFSAVTYAMPFNSIDIGVPMTQDFDEAAIEELRKQYPQRPFTRNKESGLGVRTPLIYLHQAFLNYCCSPRNVGMPILAIIETARIDRKVRSWPAMTVVSVTLIHQVTGAYVVTNFIIENVTVYDYKCMRRHMRGFMSNQSDVEMAFQTIAEKEAELLTLSYGTVDPLDLLEENCPKEVLQLPSIIYMEDRTNGK